MIVFCCQKHTIRLIAQAQRGFLLFLTVNQGFMDRLTNHLNTGYSLTDIIFETSRNLYDRMKIYDIY